MAIDATLKVKQINSINPYGDGWNRHMGIDIDSIELVECVKTVGTNIVNALTSHTSLTREQAIEVLTALKDDLIPCAKIHY